jgi:hypothetical protein
VCNRALQFWEFAQNSVAPSVHLDRAREWTQLRTRNHTLCMAWFQKLIRILTGTAQDCGSQDIRTSLAFGWSEAAVNWAEGEVNRVAMRPDFWCLIVKMYFKMSFFDVFERFARCFCRIRYYKTFSHSLTSKSARSTLTSHGTIRVRIWCYHLIWLVDNVITWMIIFIFP